LELDVTWHRGVLVGATGGCLIGWLVFALALVLDADRGIAVSVATLLAFVWGCAVSEYRYRQRIN
jgi:biotin transporter BioY